MTPRPVVSESDEFERMGYDPESNVPWQHCCIRCRPGTYIQGAAFGLYLHERLIHCVRASQFIRGDAAGS